MITFVCTIVLDIDYGLWIGVIALLFLNTFRNQHLKLVELGRIKDFEIHSNSAKYVTQAYGIESSSSSLKIVRPTHSIFFINADNFREQLSALCPIKDALIPKSICENVFSQFN